MFVVGANCSWKSVDRLNKLMSALFVPFSVVIILCTAVGPNAFSDFGFFFFVFLSVISFLMTIDSMLFHTLYRYIVGISLAIFSFGRFFCAVRSDWFNVRCRYFVVIFCYSCVGLETRWLRHVVPLSKNSEKEVESVNFVFEPVY